MAGGAAGGAGRAGPRTPPRNSGLLALRGSETGKVYRIGYLSPSPRVEYPHRILPAGPARAGLDRGLECCLRIPVGPQRLRAPARPGQGIGCAGVPGILRHDLRRTAVRNMEQVAVPHSVAMKLTGHKTENVYRRYAIVSPADLQAAAARLSSCSSGDRRGSRLKPVLQVVRIPGTDD